MMKHETGFSRLKERQSVMPKQEQAQNAAKRSIVFALLMWLFFGLFLEDPVLSMALGMLCFFPVFACLQYYPKAKRKHYAALVEAGLPFCLMNIAVELGLGVQLAKAMEHASQEDRACGKEFKTIMREIREQGASVEAALRHFSERIESQMVKRAVMQLASVSEQGGKNAEPVKRIASEILARQRIECRMFSGKLVVFSLLFIAVSAIVPALFQSFSIVGSVVLQMQFTAAQLFAIIVIGFPLLDLAVLLYIRAKTPVFLRMR